MASEVSLALNLEFPLVQTGRSYLLNLYFEFVESVYEPRYLISKKKKKKNSLYGHRTSQKHGLLCRQTKQRHEGAELRAEASCSTAIYTHCALSSWDTTTVSQRTSTSLALSTRVTS